MYTDRTMHLALGVGILLTDVWTKSAAARTRGREKHGRSPIRFRFVAHRNPAYEGNGRAVFGGVWVAALLCAVALNRWTGWFHSPFALAGLGLLFGGSAGNLIDILRLGYVVDTFDVGWWPVFNVADVAIVTGFSAALLG
jgi:lipoprotein signal peptidase